MKLNYDCVRDVLLALEDNLALEEFENDGDTSLSFSYININGLTKIDNLKKYSKKDILYSVNKLNEAEYISAEGCYGNDTCDYLISDITYKGHEFLQSIKSDTTWNDVKNVTKKVGSISFPIISSIASSILSKVISAAMGIPPQ